MAESYYPSLLGVGKAAPDAEPCLGLCPQFRRDTEKQKATKIVRGRCSTDNSPTPSQGLD